MDDLFDNRSLRWNRLSARLSDCDLWLQSREYLEVMRTIFRRIIRREGDRGPDVFAAACHIEIRRHHADDGVGHTVQLEDTIQHAAIAVEAIHPEAIADHGDVRSARRVFVCGERSADN